MQNNIRKYIVAMLGLVMLMPMACEDDIDPVIEELKTDRAFAPVGLTARVRNQVDIELSWTADPVVSQYVIEFFSDSLRFSGDPVSTAVIDEVPASGRLTYTETFNGETLYSARVKALTEGQNESNWATVAIRTDPEQIFAPIDGPNVQDTYATVQWTPGSAVTHFLVVPGNKLVQISSAESAAGEATIEGLDGATDYTVTIYNNSSKRGTVEFSTLKQSNVSPLDDLGAVIDAAADGDILILAAGNYTLGSKEIAKSITIEGQKSYDMPVIDGQFTCATAVGILTLKYLNMQGNDSYGQFFNASAAACNLGVLNIEGCEISGYSNNIIYSNSGGTYGDISITNTYIHDIPGGGGDGFDFRGGNVGSLTVENTTISNGVRTLLRMQVPADVVFRNCTFYQVCIADNSNNRGFFRMSGGGESLEVSKCLFVETGLEANGTIYGNWSRAGDISEEVTTDYRDNYYNATIGLWEGGITDPGVVDATEADPGFVDAANGDFSVTNQTLIDENVGDTRWLQ
ncbi:MAG: DUF4957 domain-containing protein [Cyclobacteriaceae bacterium]